MPGPRKILFIQTAFIGDAILASAMWEAWHGAFPEDEIHVCVRLGNEALFQDHPINPGTNAKGNGCQTTGCKSQSGVYIHILRRQEGWKLETLYHPKTLNLYVV